MIFYYIKCRNLSKYSSWILTRYKVNVGIFIKKGGGFKIKVYLVDTYDGYVVKKKIYRLYIKWYSLEVGFC